MFFFRLYVAHTGGSRSAADTATFLANAMGKDGKLTMINPYCWSPIPSQLTLRGEPLKQFSILTMGWSQYPGEDIVDVKLSAEQAASFTVAHFYACTTYKEWMYNCALEHCPLEARCDTPMPESPQRSYYLEPPGYFDAIREGRICINRKGKLVGAEGKSLILADKSRSEHIILMHFLFSFPTRYYVRICCVYV